MHEQLVVETRNGWLECEHRGSICGIDRNLHISYALGDIQSPMFLRSAGKPLQAIPVVRNGVLEHYGLDDKELALMTASHRGESYHIETMEHIMEQSGLEEDRLICNPSYPLNEETKELLLRAGGQRRRAYHNCAGKHFGVLAWSKMMNWDLGTYTEPDHPAQVEIARTLSEMSNMSCEQMRAGTDGCGFPVYALPLPGIATAYLKLACPELIEDADTRRAVTRIRKAMHRYPLLVGGTQRIDSILMEDDNIIAKGGFKGIFAFALRSEGLGFAFKVADGSDEEWALIVASILEQIGYERTETIESIRRQFPETLTNDNGKTVGAQKAVFTFN
ncbi:asparaginase [Paenibacillus profundus]|uniref:Asparaginase n=1 Tax=Paenibacillus profundus TaxID=1173085 RepID=A0ABS8YNM4_9BACL|nr:asparaginase [Paenibacillus profundus]MCE5171930.1 asparaginase [Paenibacillus profundus]